MHAIPSVWQRAADIAAEAHAGQTAGNGAPYISHAVRVAMIVQLDFGCLDPEVAAAALLHDTLEKTAFGQRELRAQFSPRVAEMVELLSKNMVSDGGGYWELLRNSDWQIRLVKMADSLDHFDCPLEHVEHRIQGGKKALSLANSDEEPVATARLLLDAALVQAEARLA